MTVGAEVNGVNDRAHPTAHNWQSFSPQDNACGSILSQGGSKYRAENVVNGPTVAVDDAPLAAIFPILCGIEEL